MVGTLYARQPQTDIPVLSTVDGQGTNPRIECIMPPIRSKQINAFAMQLDGYMSGGLDGLACVLEQTTNTLTIYGLSEMAGLTLSAVIAGCYLGDAVVDSYIGALTFTNATYLTSTNFFAWSDSGTPDGDFWEYSATRVMLANNGSLSSTLWLPVIVGSKFKSQGQLLRVSSMQEGKSQTGPTIAELRRFKHIGAHVRNTQSMSVGVGGDPYPSVGNATTVLEDGGGNEVFEPQLVYPAFVNLTPMPFDYPGGQTFSNNQDNPGTPGTGDFTPVKQQNGFNGILWTPINDQFTFDGCVAWQVNDPFPCGLLSIGGFFEVQSRG